MEPRLRSRAWLAARPTARRSKAACVGGLGCPPSFISKKRASLDPIDPISLFFDNPPHLLGYKLTLPTSLDGAAKTTLPVTLAAVIDLVG